MKTSTSITAGLVAGIFALTGAAHAQVTANFDTGFTVGASPNGVDDPGVPGTATWAAAGSTTISNYKGSNALKFDTSAASAPVCEPQISLAAAGLVMNDASQRLRASFDYAYVSGTEAIFFRFGNSISTGNTKDWFQLRVDGSTIQLWTQGATVNTAVTLKNAGTSIKYSDFSDTGSYLNFNLVIDPFAKKYVSLELTGSKGGVAKSYIMDLSAYELPWKHNVAGTADPALLFGFRVDGNTTGTASLVGYVDNVSLTNFTVIPEPSSYAFLAGAASLALLGVRRRR